MNKNKITKKEFKKYTQAARDIFDDKIIIMSFGLGKKITRHIDKAITLGKKCTSGDKYKYDQHKFRRLESYMGGDENLAHKIIKQCRKNSISSRSGGYTSIIKTEKRNGRQSCCIRLV